MKILYFYLFLFFSCSGIKFNNSFSTHKKWNIFFYVGADNDLFNHGYYTVTNAAAGYLDNPYINIFLMCDGITYKKDPPFPTEAFYFKLEEGSLLKLDFKGVYNSGSLDSFKNFIDFVINNFEEADYNALFLWGHGTHLKILSDEIDKDIFLIDNSAGKAFSFIELGNAVNYLANKLNKKIDILGIDACSMMNAELAYSLKDYAHYFISSQIEQNALSWNYHGTFNYLSKNFNIDPAALALNIVRNYQNFYEIGIFEAPINIEEILERGNDVISVLNLNYIENFNNFFKKYLTQLIYFINNDKEFKKEFSLFFQKIISKKYSNFFDIKRLIVLIDNCKHKYSNQLNLYSTELLKEFEKTVIFKFNRKDEEELNGISIRNINVLRQKSYYPYKFGGHEWIELLRLIKENDK